MREQTKNSYGRRNKAVLGGRNCEEASEKKGQERKRKQAAGSATTFCVGERLMWLIMRKRGDLCNVQHVSSGEERRAHNPEVLGSKPRHAISFSFFFMYFHSVLATELLLLVYYVYCVCLVLESN